MGGGWWVTKLGLPYSISLNIEWPCLPVSLFVTVGPSMGTGDMWSPAGSAGHPSCSLSSTRRGFRCKRIRSFPEISARRAGEKGLWYEHAGRTTNDGSTLENWGELCGRRVLCNSGRPRELVLSSPDFQWPNPALFMKTVSHPLKPRAWSWRDGSGS